jgi:glucosamine-6-phosphate deaminase
VRVVIHQSFEDVSRWAANYIAEKINSQSKDKPFVLGLPTGSSPLGVYRELIKMHKENGLSFKNVRTFNMDEYVGLSADHPQSYHYFMMKNFFYQIDIDLKHVHILDGMAKDLQKECLLFEQKIAAEGGIDFFLGGIGVDGHIAFNEPGSSLTSRTRIKTLTLDTRTSNLRFFEGDISKVPIKALTVGIGTIMDAREVMLIIGGRCKAPALRAIVEEGINHMWTASCLQMHPKAVIACDEDATEELKVRTVRYFKDNEKKFIV